MAYEIILYATINGHGYHYGCDRAALWQMYGRQCDDCEGLMLLHFYEHIYPRLQNEPGAERFPIDIVYTKDDEPFDCARRAFDKRLFDAFFSQHINPAPGRHPVMFESGLPVYDNDNEYYFSLFIDDIVRLRELIDDGDMDAYIVPSVWYCRWEVELSTGGKDGFISVGDYRNNLKHILGSFYHENVELVNVPDKTNFPLDLTFSLDGEDVVTMPLFFNELVYHHYFDKGWITPTEDNPTGRFTWRKFMQMLCEMRSKYDGNNRSSVAA